MKGGRRYAYIDMHNKNRSSFQGLYRIDTRDYPEEALREALLNCCVHRDYAFSASTLVSIFEDRMEFVSVGGLVDGIELEDVLLGLSVCRNPKLAAIFYRLVVRSEVEQLLGISQASAIRLLKYMSDNGMIKRVGRGKSTRYIK